MASPKATYQQSVISFDYNAFYSCSSTIVGGGTEATPPKDHYDLSLPHPYLFAVEQPSVKVGSNYHTLPLVVGEIVDPGYAGA